MWVSNCIYEEDIYAIIGGLIAYRQFLFRIVLELPIYKE